MSAGGYDPQDVCARHGLTVLEDFSRRGSTSATTLRVRDTAGAEYVLRQARPEAGATEAAVLRAWHQSGVTPRVITELEPGLLLLEWLPGRSMAEVPVGEPVDIHEIGRALAVLHRTPPRAEIPDVRTSFVLEPPDAWTRLPRSLYLLAVHLAIALRQHEPGAPVLLHADLVPANVILTPHGPKFIDPVGRRGFAAWDVAQLAAASEGWGRGILAPFLAGYGTVPPMVAETFAWMILFYLQKNLAVPGSPFTKHLQVVAATLDAAGDAEKFLHTILAESEVSG